VAIANALQLNAASPFYFNYDAMPPAKFEVAEAIHCRIMAFCCDLDL